MIELGDGQWILFLKIDPELGNEKGPVTLYWHDCPQQPTVSLLLEIKEHYCCQAIYLLGCDNLLTIFTSLCGLTLHGYLTVIIVTVAP